MMVHAPDGAEVVLVDVGQIVLLENKVARVWDVSLAPGEVHPWHLHHNPYVVLSIEASPGRMDWLDGSPPRYLDEYPGGAVLRPTSPVHRLTNIGNGHYRNRLVELKELGELRRDGVAELDLGEGMRSFAEVSPGPAAPDGRVPVLPNRRASVWTVSVPPEGHWERAALDVPALIVPITGATEEPIRFIGTRESIRITNSNTSEQQYFVVTIDYLRSTS